MGWGRGGSGRPYPPLLAFSAAAKSGDEQVLKRNPWAWLGRGKLSSNWTRFFGCLGASGAIPPVTSGDFIAFHLPHSVAALPLAWALSRFSGILLSQG